MQESYKPFTVENETSSYLANLAIYRQQAEEKVILFNSAYKSSFSSFFSLTARKKKYALLQKWSQFTFEIEDLADGGINVFNYDPNGIKPKLDKSSLESVVKIRMQRLFVDCSPATEKYVLSGYSLKQGWEIKLLKLMQDEEISALDDEIIFVIFLLELTIEQAKDVSVLPKSYITRLLLSSKK